MPSITLGIAIGAQALGVVVDWPNVFEGVFVGVLQGVTQDDVSFLEGALTFAKAYFPLFFLTYFRAPIYLLEASWTSLLAILTRFGIQPSKLARQLPFRHHEVILFPLPLLSTYLVALGEENPALAQELLTEAADTFAQKHPARKALLELQAHSLEHAARERLYPSVANLSLPFLPTQDPEPRFLPFQKAAEDLHAARDTTNQHHRRRSLERARTTLQSALTQRTTQRRPPLEERRLLPTLRRWLDVVADEQAALARDVAEHPQIPIPWITGVPLRPEGDAIVDARALFKGRRDLVRLIDQDLTGGRREPILLVGQRRMGKTSLLHMLPERLGTGTRVVAASFQGLSGSPDRAHPHRLIAAAIIEALRGESPDAEPPPEASTWGPILDWLEGLDARLTADDQRLLVAVDEVEGLARGMRDGWATADVLDLFRAAGDRLHRIRFLLATAHPLPRLGPQWVDRLINVHVRRLGPLDEPDARALVCEPIPGYAYDEIYPEGGRRAHPARDRRAPLSPSARLRRALPPTQRRAPTTGHGRRSRSSLRSSPARNPSFRRALASPDGQRKTIAHGLRRERARARRHAARGGTRSRARRAPISPLGLGIGAEDNIPRTAALHAGLRSVEQGLEIVSQSLVAVKSTLFDQLDRAPGARDFLRRRGLDQVAQIDPVLWPRLEITGECFHGDQMAVQSDRHNESRGDFDKLRLGDDFRLDSARCEQKIDDNALGLAGSDQADGR